MFVENRIFDVARWSTEDIRLCLPSNIEALSLGEQCDFVEAVIIQLGDYFDANNGINWTTISLAIEKVNETWK